MIKKILAVAILLAATMLAGCFDYQETMVLNKDGSGTLAMRLGMQKSMLDGMKAMTQAFSQEEDQPAADEPFISKEAIEKNLAKSKAGVKLLDYKESVDGEMQVWDITYSFENLNDVQYITESLNDDFDAMADMGEAVDSSMGEEEGMTDENMPELRLFVRGMDTGDGMMGMPAGGEMDDETEGYEEESAESHDESAGEMKKDEAMPDSAGDMSGMMEGMDKLAQTMSKYGIKLTVKFPGKVIESNATTIDGNTATWEYKLSDMGKFPNKLTAVVK